jgi:OmpA-OmpF porin, OOP family
MKLPVLLLASSLLIAAAPASTADRGFYAGAGLGQMNTEVDDVLGLNYDFDEDDTGFKVFGGYRFFPWLSVEGAYLDGGNPSIKESGGSETVKLGIDVQSLVAAAVFALPVGERFELFVKPGIAYWDAETSLSFTSSTFSDSFREDDNGSAFFLGAGAGFDVTDNFGLRLEYEWFEVAPEWDSDSDEFVDELDANAGFFSASFLFRF